MTKIIRAKGNERVTCDTDPNFYLRCAPGGDWRWIGKACACCVVRCGRLAGDWAVGFACQGVCVEPPPPRVPAVGVWVGRALLGCPASGVPAVGVVR